MDFKAKVRILFLVTEDWYFWSHRLPIARAAREMGFEVLVATRVDEHGELIRNEGFRLIPLANLKRRSQNPFRELLCILELLRLYRKEKPTIVHQVAIKPVLYGSWAARLSGVPVVVNALAGLGHIFLSRGFKASIYKGTAKFAYRSAMSMKNTRVIFQNPDDREMFVDAGIVGDEKTVLIKGSGIDAGFYNYTVEPGGVITVVLISRMLWTKGIGEFVEASAILRQRGCQFRAVLVGTPDPENPASIDEATLEEWQAKGLIEWWGWRDDIPEVLAQSHIVCLPSYREGVPKALIEAAACGRPVVTTDTPGCREIVRDNENGLLVPVRDPKALADALAYLLENPEARRSMGLKGREIAAGEFSVEMVVEKTLALYKELLGEVGLVR